MNKKIIITCALLAIVIAGLVAGLSHTNTAQPKQPIITIYNAQYALYDGHTYVIIYYGANTWLLFSDASKDIVLTNVYINGTDFTSYITTTPTYEGAVSYVPIPKANEPYLNYVTVLFQQISYPPNYNVTISLIFSHNETATTNTVILPYNGQDEHPNPYP